MSMSEAERRARLSLDVGRILATAFAEMSDIALTSTKSEADIDRIRVLLTTTTNRLMELIP